LATVDRRRSWAPSIAAQLATLLAVHVLLWTWVGVSSRSNLDAPGDMVEAYAWSQGWQWGYYKHPPLSAWVAGLWFSVAPASQLGYSLLAALNGAVGLAGLAVLAREFLPRPWVLLVVAVASLAPGITALAMRFNANAILISSWPWAIALFVRLMQRGRRHDAVLCGLVCALAMLGKYYSGVLLLSLLAAAICVPDWRRRLLSAPAALAVAVFAVAVAPHLVWLLSQTQGPLQYAYEATARESHAQAAVRALHFGLVQCIFPLLALAALRVALVGPGASRAFGQAVIAPLRPRRDGVWLLAMLPILLTMLVTVVTEARTAWVWGLPIAAGLALLAGQRAIDAGARLSLPRLWRMLLAIWAAVALLSPLWWNANAALRSPAVAEPREELAGAVAKVWQTRFGRPLPEVAGTRALAASVAFYTPDHPRYWSLWNATVETPWVTPGAVQAWGSAIVCDSADRACEALAGQWSSDRQTLVVSKHERGYRFEPHRYALYLVPPSTAPGEPDPGAAPAAPSTFALTRLGGPLGWFSGSLAEYLERVPFDTGAEAR
jgi:4-amino-4-deoxy-L-arabinose transferase-like glycosyltransferase